MMGTSDKLRNYAENWAGHEVDRLLAIEAADEIDRLKKENATFAMTVETVREAVCDQ